jgi:hypothetical protein
MRKQDLTVWPNGLVNMTARDPKSALDSNLAGPAPRVSSTMDLPSREKM